MELPDLLSAGNLRHHRAKKRLSRPLGLNSSPLTTPFGSTLLMSVEVLGLALDTQWKMMTRLIALETFARSLDLLVHLVPLLSWFCSVGSVVKCCPSNLKRSSMFFKVKELGYNRASTT
ncbi:hypothetical protein F8388_023404 [Cannabis sativa]|uniref:Uncharacterized protein n=1 Tax=Cannabis sativa TaxID=3483 RepID=A0A7J6HGQ4_CANSA|nr:hypothetical protein F8388_023404 [Cannabis sativa]